MTTEKSIIEDIVKSTFKSSSYIVENGLIIGSEYNGIFYTVNISDRIPISYNWYPDQISYNYIKQAYNHLSQFKDGAKNIYFNPSLRDDPLFEQQITRKVSEGEFKYYITTDNLRNVFITLYPQIFHLNKGDTLGLKIYENPLQKNILLADFELYKKKLNMPYNIEFLFLTFDTKDHSFN